MELHFRAALLAWLSADPLLSAGLNTIAEEAPLRASPPWLGIVASASSDFGHKTGQGREVRVALELQTLGDNAAGTAALTSAIEARIAAMPADQPGFRIASLTFLRARAEQRGEARRAVLLEYRARLIAA
ncbi:MAG: DUF3168 domain-containing protein [Novosphingobium sp.]|nr:DUF3168 domain-containing protein [Novosphingobium sp.]